MPADAPIELGYIVLPLDMKCVGLLLAEWDDAMLLSADLKAHEVDASYSRRAILAADIAAARFLRRLGRHLPRSAHAAGAPFLDGDAA